VTTKNELKELAQAIENGYPYKIFMTGDNLFLVVEHPYLTEDDGTSVNMVLEVPNSEPPTDEAVNEIIYDSSSDDDCCGNSCSCKG
jgi:hypothetical protein